MPRGSSRGRSLNDKGHALNLMLVVECQAANVGIWVRLLALTDLVKDLGGVVAAEHRQLPERPVSPVVVPRHPAIFSMHVPHLP